MTAILVSAVVSRGLEAGSVIAVLQVIIASLTACPVTVIKVELHLMCVTQTQEGVSAREMLLGSGVILVGKGPSILTPQTLSAVPAASALESLTSVRAPANVGGSLLICRAGVWKVPTERRLHLC